MRGIRDHLTYSVFQPVRSVLWAATVPNVVWSLAYEMVFYLMITALFLGGVHQRSCRYALVLLIEVYDSVPWTRNQNFVPMELLLVAVFILVLLVCCGLTYRFIEAPMQRLGRRAARRPDARFGPDSVANLANRTLVTPIPSASRSGQAAPPGTP